jgi:hypothetical protein
MLVCNYKPTCSYSFTVTLSGRQCPMSCQTLPEQWRLAHRKLDLPSTMANCHPLSIDSRQLRPRILPRHGLARVDSSIQSP